MKHICTILLICGLFAGQAWGQDVGHCINGDCFDAGGNPVETYSIYATESGDLLYDGTDQVKAYPHDERAEIRAILEKCREFLAPPPDHSTTLAIYRTRLGELEYQIELEKERLAKEERREQLRRDIDALIERLQ